jgi:hypothetical protein
MRRSLLLVPLVVAAMTACGGDDDVADSVPVPTDTAETAGPPSEPTTATTGSAPLTPPPPAAATTGPGSAAPVGHGRDVAQAVADLAGRAGVAEADITVVSSENVTWRDSSLGCPREGMQYLQVLTDGVRIVLEAGGERYEYHGGGRRPVFYCAAPEAPVGE